MKNSHDLLCLLLPTNEPNVYHDYFEKSLTYLKDASKFITISINFQSPWTQDEIKTSVEYAESLGFQVVWSFNKYEILKRGEVPFNRIRHQCAAQFPHAKFYGLCDDDFAFAGPTPTINKTAGHQYLDILDYLLTHERCGFVLQGGTMYKWIPRNHIGITKLDTAFITGRGFVFRRMDDFLVYPDDALDLVGAGEEKIVAASRMAEGYYPAKMGFSRTNHEGGRLTKRKIPTGEEMYGWLKEEIFENNTNQYIRDHYNPDLVGVYNYNVVDTDLYFSQGGRSPYQEYDELLQDYTSSTVEDLTKKIQEMIVNE